jgi:Zn-dependent metalloprotease
MPFSRRALHLLLLSLGAAACVAPAPDDTASSPTDREARLAAKLEADTGVGWKVYVEPRSGEVRFLAPLAATGQGLAAGSVEQKARALFERYGVELGKTDREELRVKDNTTDTFGNQSVRFEHFLAGTDLPVFESSSLAEVTSDGALIHIEPGFHHDLDGVARAETITASAAEQAALDDVRSSCGAAPSDHVVKKRSTLGVFAEPGSPAALAWAVDVRTSSANCAAPRVFVDATTGAVLATRETAAAVLDHAGGVRNRMQGDAKDIKELDVTEVADFIGSHWILSTSGPSPKVSTYPYAFFQSLEDEFPTKQLGVWDPLSPFPGAAVDAHYYSSKALDYFSAVHRRSGLDGKGSDLVVVVHDPEATSSGRNAHYFDYGILFTDDQIHVGDGGGGWLPLSVGFDVMAHELTHGITAHTSGLIYERDSGALNEGFSDVMGASAEQWLPETRNAVANLLIGERVTTDGRGLRDMTDPSSRGDIDHYKDVPACGKPSADNDRCGVHSNSGIADRAFSLMVVGGLHKTSRVAVATGIGWEKSRELWFNTLTKLGPTSNYPMAAYVQLAVAATRGADVLNATACAWFAVGVLDAVDLRVRNLVCNGSNPAPPPTASSLAPAPSPPSSAPGCHGSTTAFVCSDGTPGFAVPCDAHSTTAFCADPTQACKRASATDATATVSADGALQCE